MPHFLPIVILLGASDYPKEPDLPGAESFRFAADAIRACLMESYFSEEGGISRMLDLFDTEMDGPSIDNCIAEYLVEQIDGKAEGARPTDLLVFYIGHGGFRDASSEYYLAIRTTQKRNRYFHSLPLGMLAGTIRRHAAKLRRYLFIDACFAGAAVANFQSPLPEVVRTKVSEVVWFEKGMPNAGTALLCASSKDAPAEFVNASGTMFLDALTHVLRHGCHTRGDWLSIRDLHALVHMRILESYGDAGVLPELHIPDQKRGNIEISPLFRNAARFQALPAAAPTPRTADDTANHLRLGNPTKAETDAGKPDNYLIKRPQWVGSYNASQGRPNWVAWELRREDFGDAPRPYAFNVDPLLPKEILPVRRSEYVRSGYDCGHMCPPADRTASPEDRAGTMFMTNIVPQSARYNQGAWGDFEQYCRALCVKGYVLNIIAGADGEVDRIADRISVPAQLWKVVVAAPERPGKPPQIDAEARVIAVRMLNSDRRVRHANWRIFRTSVAFLENDLLLNDKPYQFFTSLPNKLADDFRARFDTVAD
jgi:endonuclease G